MLPAGPALKTPRKTLSGLPEEGSEKDSKGSSAQFP